MTSADIGGQDRVRLSLRDRMRDMEEKRWGLLQGAAAFMAFEFRIEVWRSGILEAHALETKLVRRPISWIRCTILALVVLVAIVSAATSDFVIAVVLLLVVAFALYKRFHRRREEVHIRADVDFARFVGQLEPDANVLSMEESKRALVERAHGSIAQLRRFLLGYQMGVERALVFVDDFANVVVLDDRVAESLSEEAGVIDEAVAAKVAASLTYFPWRLRTFRRSAPKGLDAARRSIMGNDLDTGSRISAQVPAQPQAASEHPQGTDQHQNERQGQ